MKIVDKKTYEQKEAVKKFLAESKYFQFFEISIQLTKCMTKTEEEK
jgi:hypothetical protein